MEGKGKGARPGEFWEEREGEVVDERQPTATLPRFLAKNERRLCQPLSVPAGGGRGRSGGWDGDGFELGLIDAWTVQKAAKPRDWAVDLDEGLDSGKQDSLGPS